MGRVSEGRGRLLPSLTGKGYGFLLWQANKFERASLDREWGKGRVCLTQTLFVFDLNSGCV
jgi:hypothetical protein